jgi:hypothetical protein
MRPMLRVMGTNAKTAVCNKTKYKINTFMGLSACWPHKLRILSPEWFVGPAVVLQTLTPFFPPLFFLVSWGGVRLSPLATSANICRGNRSTRRKPAPVPLCLPQIPHDDLGSNPGRRGGKPATNRLSYATAFPHVIIGSKDK